MSNKALNIRSQINNFLTVNAESKHQINNTELKAPSVKVKNSQRNLVRGIAQGASKDTLHIRTISGAMVAAIADLDASTVTSDIFSAAIAAVKDSEGTTLLAGSSFAPSTSLRKSLSSVMVVLPDGTLAVDDVGKSPGFSRPIGITSIKQGLRQLVRSTDAGLLHFSSVSGAVLRLVDGLLPGTTLGDLVLTIQSFLGESTSVVFTTVPSSVPSANILDVINSVIKEDVDGSFIIDDVGVFDVATKNKSKKIYDIVDSVVESSGELFFLKTVGGDVMDDLSLVSGPTALDFIGLI